jgi:type I restriction enzyme M protein
MTNTAFRRSGAASQAEGEHAPRDRHARLEQLEADLWEAADNLRANSKLTSSDYFMPVLGVIFLRHAANRFAHASRQIEADQVSGKMPRRPIVPADYHRRRALWLPEEARYDWMMDRAAVGGSDLPALVTGAMTAIERAFEPLQGVLPKDYAIFEPTVLEDLLRLFNSQSIRDAPGDVFGRIYEYFLAKFSIQKAHDNGEFFTPPSLVQAIVNVIEPDNGTVFDPACGSGGMFVQTSHFIEDEGADTAQRVVFYGQEKNRDTIRIAQMNLAVHGLEGKIAEAITYYQDEHNLVGKCDFVMANPPFNVDLVDAERIKNDPRLPFNLPGSNKEKKVPNANFLWISYFWSYLSEAGRAGFVMSSQASSAGHGERDVRRKIVETGDVDVMIAIRPNFFYTRSVPCELWHFDRGKPEERRSNVLMLDARSLYRKVSRKVNDFAPEQLQNLAAIVWLYRGQQTRFLALVEEYLSRLVEEAGAVVPALASFDSTLHRLRGMLDRRVEGGASADSSFGEAAAELEQAVRLYEADAAAVVDAFLAFAESHANAMPSSNAGQHNARSSFEATAEAARALVKQVDLLYKLATRAAERAADEVAAPPSDYDRRAVSRQAKQLEADRRAAVDQLRYTIYLYRQIAWLQDRFPQAELRDVPGLVKLVTVDEIEETDWSLSPPRYVGIAPPEMDEDFDFEESVREIGAELAELDAEATQLAARIQENLGALGA